MESSAVGIAILLQTFGVVGLSSLIAIALVAVRYFCFSK